MACHCAEGWICEEHTTQPAGHDGCTGASDRCDNPDCPWWKGPAPAALDKSDWTNRVNVDGKPTGKIH